MNRISLILLSICAILVELATLHAAIPQEEEDKLYLEMRAAVDRDCDGELWDELSADRSFEMQKSLSPEQCLIYRTEYRNDGSFPIRHLRVTNQMPGMMQFIQGTTEHVKTPPGLRPDTPLLPLDSKGGELIWRFDGALAPGERGALQFRARLLPKHER